MPPHLSLYNQNSVADEDFVAGFVARMEVLATLIRRLKTAHPDHGNLHQNLVGARGVGKTSLLRRISIEINRDEELSAKYIPLRFREEQYNVISLNDFLRNCCEALAEWAESTGRNALADLIDDDLISKNFSIEDAALEIFQSRLLGLERRPVLLLDNMDLILNALSDDENWKFRKQLQAKDGPIIIGASTQPLKQSTNKDAPFYEFFQPHYLEALDIMETERCMRTLASGRGGHGSHVIRVLDEQPERLKILHTLTGGNPRVITLIYRLLETSESDAAMADLEVLLDQMTPYYKARIEEYHTPHQRAVIDAISLHWDPITTGDLSRVTSITSTTLSPLIIRLRKDGLIESVETSGSYSGHQIVERFFNIWYLMRHGTRRTKQKMRWLVAFLSSFYSINDLTEIEKVARIKGYLSNWHNDYAFAFEEALLRHVSHKSNFNHRAYSNPTDIDNLNLNAHTIGGQRQIRDNISKIDELMDKAFGFLEEGDLNKSIEFLDDVIKTCSTVDHPDARGRMVAALFNKSGLARRIGDTTASIEICSEIEHKFYSENDESLHGFVARAMLEKAFMFGIMNNHVEEIAVYDKIISQFGGSNKLSVVEQVAKSLNNKAIRLIQSNDKDIADELLNQIIERFGDNEAPTLHEQVVMALNSKAAIVNARGDYGRAIEIYDDIISRLADEENIDLCVQAAIAMNNKAIALVYHNRIVDGLREFDKIISKFVNNDNLSLKVQAAIAYNNKGSAITRLEDGSEAIHMFDEVVKLYGEIDEVEMREQVARALCNKGVSLNRLNDSVAAIAVYDDVAARFERAEEPIIRQQVAMALNNKAITHGNLEDLETALSVLDGLINRLEEDDDPELLRQFALALNNKGITLSRMGDDSGAVSAYDKVIKQFDDYDDIELNNQVAGALVNKGVTVDSLGDHQAAIELYKIVEDRFSAVDHSSIRSQVARALSCKSIALVHIGDIRAASDACDAIIDQSIGSDDVDLRRQVALAFTIKANIMEEMLTKEEMLTVYDMMMARFDKDDDEVVQEMIARTLNNKASMLGRMDEHAEGILVCDETYRRFKFATSANLREYAGRSLLIKTILLSEMGQFAEQISTYDILIDFLQRDELLSRSELKVDVDIRFANLLIDIVCDAPRAEAILKSIEDRKPDIVKANLAWLYIISNRSEEARIARNSINTMLPAGLALIDAGINLIEDNFGLAVRELETALSSDLKNNEHDFSEDVDRLVRLMERSGNGERLLDWFESNGLSDRSAPLYVAIKAYVRTEKALLDVNPEVRQAAKQIFLRLELTRKIGPRLRLRTMENV